MVIYLVGRCKPPVCRPPKEIFGVTTIFHASPAELPLIMLVVTNANIVGLEIAA